VSNAAKPEPCAGRFDDLADGGRFVAAEIVHNDDVVGFKNGHELLLDTGAEARAVDRSIEDTKARSDRSRTAAGHRRYVRRELRRGAILRVAETLGLSLSEIRAMLVELIASSIIRMARSA
jgi:hypothetical protein